MTVSLLTACGARQLPSGASGAMLQNSIAPTGSFQVLHRFNGSDGEQPEADLINVNDTLYGTTNYGGRYGYGTAFSASLTGSEKVLYSFKGGADGSMPQAGLIDVKGTLYGTTSAGGAAGCDTGYGCGTVYSISTTGSEKVLHSFGGGGDGANAPAGLVDVNGTLYGTQPAADRPIAVPCTA